MSSPTQVLEQLQTPVAKLNVPLTLMSHMGGGEFIISHISHYNQVTTAT